MRIKAITDVEKFFALIDGFEGKAELVTDSGDRYNLKSKLSQLVATAKVLSSEDDIDADLVISDPEEEKMIKAFLINK